MKRYYMGLVLVGFCLVSSARTSDPEPNELSDPRWHVRRQAVNVLAEIQDAASPHTAAAIASALRDVDSRVRRAAAEAAGKAGLDDKEALDGLVMLLKDPDPRVRAAAAEALGRLGRSARRAVPGLLETMHDLDPDVRRETLDSLGIIGPAKFGEAKRLSEGFADADPQVRTAAARALGAFGRAARKPLAEALGDDDPAVRRAAAQSLGGMGRWVVPTLIEALHSGNPTVLEAVLDALEGVGSATAEALTRVLKDEDEPGLTRRYAALGLGRIGGGSKQAEAALIGALESDAPGVRLAGVQGLARLTPPSPDGATPLIRLLGDVNQETLLRKHAARALGRLATDHPEAVAALAEALEEGTPVLQDAAVAALTEAVESPTVAVPSGPDIATLVDRLTHADSTIRMSAVQALGQRGPAAASAASPLAALVRSNGEDGNLRVEAARSLGLIGPRARAAAPDLIRAMHDADPGLRQQLLLAIRRIGPPPQDSLPGLMRLLGHDDAETRESTALEIRQFALDRLDAWRPLLASARAPILRTWVARHPALYGIRELPKLLSPTDRAPSTFSPFEVLGGFAAIRETIQVQSLTLTDASQGDWPTIPIDRVEGLAVESLDFKELLAKEKGSDDAFPLARFVPPDRLFAYVAHPSSLLQVFGDSAAFSARLRSILTRADVRFDLPSRYIRRLGLREPAVLAVLATADVQDLAVVLPDLFLADGTDITVLIRCSRPDRVRFVLEAAGMAELAAGQILERPTGPGTAAWWGIRENLIVISTRRQELDSVLDLHRSGGRGSLGNSDEFKYMLRRLPLLPTSRAYLYLSDPFLRKLVGPATKIAQTRRTNVRRDLEFLTSMALLYKMDGHPGTPNCRTLQRLGYLPGGVVRDDYALGSDLVAVSEAYGRVADLHPLSRNPATLVTRAEAEAYREYLDAYTRFWREYFDPIAIRVDETSSRTMDLSTFILPLIRNSLYEDLQEVLPGADPRVTLTTPILSPTPILMSSVSLSDAKRIDLTRQFAEEFTDYTSVAAEVLDNLGPSLHVVIHDSNPIVALGSGDLLRAVGAELTGGSDDLLGMPTLVSLLTQPCQILVEVQDPDPVVAFLEQASLAKSRKKVPGELYKVEGQERWVYHVNLAELVRLSVSVEVKNGYLVIGNLPWSQQVSIRGQTQAPLNGAQIVLNLQAMQAHRPALHMATMTDYRAMAVEGMGALFPLLASGQADTVEDASALHAGLFGFTPVHPANGTWIWEQGALRSSLFGTLDHPIQPTYRPGDQSFGLIRGVDQISVNLQMEEEGLRARLRWVASEP